MEVHKGTIVRMYGTWGSGLGMLEIDDEQRGRIAVPCDNAPTVRALDGAFGNVIGEAHTFINEAIEGRVIYYSVDEIGVLEAFTPVGEAPPELVEMYEEQGEGLPTPGLRS